MLKRVFVNPLVVQTERRQSLLPVPIASFSVGDGDRRIVVVISVNLPLESERDQRRRLDEKFLRDRPIAGPSWKRRKQKGGGEPSRRPIGLSH